MARVLLSRAIVEAVPRLQADAMGSNVADKWDAAELKELTEMNAVRPAHLLSRATLIPQCGCTPK